MYAVSYDRADPVTAHFSGRVSDNPMLILESHAKATIGQNLVDLALHRNELFLRQAISLRTKNHPHAGVSRCGAMQREREKGAVCAAVKFRRKRREAISI